jgi:hypothetical protein
MRSLFEKWLSYWTHRTTKRIRKESAFWMCLYCHPKQYNYINNNAKLFFMCSYLVNE